ncbi:TRAP transporter substrate-binding protein DctP [Paracoccus shanxieyensis]|uniref:ABC transporter substrate-binding protein n=1 Tax=Paracoccus shanxieyensis TaxID=2675752 RepID=A0A6L6IZG2_9RHOB|nr:TRAP transporter substrate-binding protein DctP [Paracoccus shanxieyensis]MTH65643.1 ABC transporter substrate-binding protein [Paracoccus shanxieyensis]MTH88782.1 ABC transporter substrate-binding protein [Paracoccus shanxieyensis]
MIHDRKTSGGNGVSRRLFLASATAAASASLLPGTVPQAQARAAPRVLAFSDHEPLGGMRTRFLKEVVFPAIERESNGRLKIQDHWDGDIAAAYDALGAVRSGTTDIGTVVPEYTAKDLPLHQIFKSFVTGPVGGRQIEFFNRVYAEAEAFPAELDRNNIVQIYFGTGYPVAFFRNAPMTGLNDLKGGKWRSASFWHLDFLKNAGATPVTMRWGPEIPQALKAGQLDGLMVNVDSGYLLKVHKTAPHVLVSKDLWLGHVYILAMNKDVWNSLAPEDKAAIGHAAAQSYATLGAEMDRSFDTQLQDLANAGATVRVLSNQEVTQFQTATMYKDVQAAWAEAQQREGVANAGPVMAQVTAIMDNMMG